MKHKAIFSLIVLSCCLTACTNVEQNAGKVFDNANSAIKPESNEVLWVGDDSAENTASKVLDNANSAVKPQSNNKLWQGSKEEEQK